MGGRQSSSAMIGRCRPQISVAGPQAGYHPGFAGPGGGPIRATSDTVRDQDLDDLPTIECLASDEPAVAEVCGGLDPHGLFYPQLKPDGQHVTLPSVHRGESGNHYFDRIYSGEDEPLPDGYQGPPRPLSVKEVFQRGHCGVVNAQAALKYGGQSRGR